MFLFDGDSGSLKQVAGGGGNSSFLHLPIDEKLALGDKEWKHIFLIEFSKVAPLILGTVENDPRFMP